MLQQTRSLPFLSIVAPCRDEAAGLAEFHRRVVLAVQGAGVGSHEIVLVNDGSRDRSWMVMRALAAGDPHLVAVNLSRGHGHQLALTAGLSVCRGDRVLIIDADLQDPPELLPAMMARMDAGADVVYGRRRRRQGETRFKRASAALFYRLLALLVDTDIPVDAGDFRLMNRRALEVLAAMPEQIRFIRGMVSWIGLRQEPIDYDRAQRFAGHTKYGLRKMLRFALDAITSFSIVPLRLASALAILLGAAGLLTLAYTLGSWLLGSTVNGWTSLSSLVLIVGGTQLMVLGVFGEYLGRLYIEAKRRPLFVIESVVGGGTEAATMAGGMVAGGMVVGADPNGPCA